jgi:N-acetylglutamate synthase-like GNAT family acetyltransferase
MKPPLTVRRATIYDLDSLKAIWVAMRVPPDNLEKRLTEFQVVESEGKINGTIGIQVQGSQALLHSEGYLDFSTADESRELFWERIQKLASNLGVFRIWTQEDCPFWLREGFQRADEALLKRLPEGWQNENPTWFSRELKNEEAIITALNTQFASFLADERKQATRLSDGARKLTLTVTVLGFGIGIISFAVAFYLLLHHPLAGR